MDPVPMPPFDLDIVPVPPISSQPDVEVEESSEWPGGRISSDSPPRVPLPPLPLLRVHVPEGADAFLPVFGDQ